MKPTGHRILTLWFIKNKALAMAGVLILIFVSFLSCNSAEDRLLQEARSETEKGRFKDAVVALEKFLVRSPDSKETVSAAREAARLLFYEIQDFNKAIKFYRILVLSAPDPVERLNAQKQIVSIYFDHLMDYPQAIIEINKMIVMLSSQKEKTEYKMKVARAYYYQNNFIQAENEVDEFLRVDQPDDLRFDMLFLKGNINLAKKDIPKSIEIFRKIILDFPERAVKENVGLTLSVCLEEQKDYKGAIEVLEKMRALYSTPEYIDIRIHRLRGRLKNLPGARGRGKK